MEARKKILITGASGFVGYHMLQAALDKGYEVFAGVRSSSLTGHLGELPLTTVSLELQSAESMKTHFEHNRYDYVIHGAGTTKAPSEATYTLVNAEYTRNIAQAAAASGVRKFVFISSLAALGPAAYTEEKQISELAEPRPLTRYGQSKLLAERILQEIPGLPYVILRPTAVYGPREKDLFIVFKLLRKGLEAYIGRKAQHLSFVYVKDLAEIAMQALESPYSQTSYNISDGKVYDRYALADIPKRIWNKKTLRIHLPQSIVKSLAGLLEMGAGVNTPALNREKILELTAENWNCSITKAQDELGYMPRYDLEAGLHETLNWYRDNRWLV